MKKLIEKLRLWLIRRLNAVPMDEHTELCREAEQKRLTERFRYAVREICRRSENTYAFTAASPRSEIPRGRYTARAAAPSGSASISARPHEKSGKSVKEPRLHSTRR